MPKRERDEPIGLAALLGDDVAGGCKVQKLETRELLARVSEAESGLAHEKAQATLAQEKAGQQIAQLKEVESALARESAVCESLMAQLGNAEAAIEREKESRVELALQVLL